MSTSNGYEHQYNKVVKNSFELQDPISILIPILNEVENLEKFIDSWVLIIKDLPKGSMLKFEDGGSSDGSR